MDGMSRLGVYGSAVSGRCGVADLALSAVCAVAATAKQRSKINDRRERNRFTWVGSVWIQTPQCTRGKQNFLRIGGKRHSTTKLLCGGTLARREADRFGRVFHPQTCRLGAVIYTDCNNHATGFGVR